MDLDKLSWEQLVRELKVLREHGIGPAAEDSDPETALHELFVHRIELEMQNRELREMQHRLEASSARYADLYDFAPVGYVTLDTKQCIVEINLTGAALLGQDRAVLVGKPFGAVARLRQPMVFHDHVRRCMTERRGAMAQCELVNASGDVRYVQLTTTPLLEHDGRVTGCRTVLTDVTDRMHAQHADDARQSAEAESRMKEQFLGIVSHELRTPLNAILGWARILSTTPALGADVVKKGLDAIHRNATAQAQIIEDLLDVSRIVLGKISVGFANVDMNELVQEVVVGASVTADTKGVGLAVAEAAEGAHVMGDRGRLRQALVNLVANALKFTPRGGKVEIGVAVARDTDAVHVTVRDTGRGIAKSELAHVFDRFHQGDATSTREHGGLGLGLTIARSIATAHGGDVVAGSDGLNKGATFTMVVPKRGAAQSPAPPRSDVAPREAIAGTKVLYVDDDESARELVTFALEDVGATVETASSVHGALATFGRFTPDVVVTDIAMPAEDGYALLREIRRMEGPARDVPTIALSAHAGADAQKTALAAGFRLYLVKPILPEVLVSAIARASSAAR